MTMRATVYRNISEADAYARAGVPVWQPKESAMPCRFWHTTGSSLETKHAGATTVRTDEVIGMCPIGSDIKEGDKIGSVKDRSSTEQFGVLYVDAVLRRANNHLSIRTRDHA